MRQTRQDGDKFFFLEDLQDIGERYSWTVLGDFFASRGIGGTREQRPPNESSRLDCLDDYVTVSESKIAFVEKLVIWNYLVFQLCLIVSVISFWFSSCWSDPRRTDPVRKSQWIEIAVPSSLVVYILVFSITLGLLGEIFACMQIIENKINLFSRWRKKNFMILASSVLAQISLVMDVMSALVFVRSGAGLLVFVSGSFFLIYMILMLLLVPLRVFVFGSQFLAPGVGSTYCHRFAAIPWRCRSDSRNCTDVRITRVTDEDPDRAEILLNVSFACIAVNWRLLDSVIASHFGTLQSMFIQQTIMTNYLSCFSYQLLQVPLKIFFLLDYGYNVIVMVSVPLSILSALIVCLTNVFPLSSLNRENV